MKKYIHQSIFTYILIVLLQSCSQYGPSLILSCEENNDLYVTLQHNRIQCIRYTTPEEAIEKAPDGAGVMILAQDYPHKKTTLEASLYEKARAKKLSLYVEYPSSVPGMENLSPRGTHWERAVISSDAFAPQVEKFRILAIHDCWFVPLQIENPDIVVARVAGFDQAVYGLPEQSFPVLGEINSNGNEGRLILSATKLSQFITARYAPTDAWTAIWENILMRIQPGIKLSKFQWKPNVRPSYSAEENLPEDVEKQALKRGIGWYINSRMVMNQEMMKQYNRPSNGADPASANPDTSQDWPFGHRVGFMPGLNTPDGDGTHGVLEGLDAKIFYDGTQPVRWWRRGDCNGEVAGAMVAAGKALDIPKFTQTGSNIADWLIFKSMISNGDRANPENPAYGLFGWNDSPQYVGVGSMDGYGVYYGDDNARLMLGIMLAQAVLNTNRYDERLLKGLLGNLRISGEYGFQHDRLDQGPLLDIGWKKLFAGTHMSFAPHYQANMWACYLWAYQHTGYDLFLKRAKTGIKMTMDAYPDHWKWANGIQQERAKMLLPLAWLVRIEDKPEHREWLDKIAGEIIRNQDKTGAIREEIGVQGKGGFPPPSSNEEYGTSETPLIQTNNDGVSDMLYTVAFAFLGLHEAAAATGEKTYIEAEERLAKFLCRIQIRSEKHPELDGGWFRAFDFNRWEYWASNGDAGWGAWCIETGWHQSWITSVLAIRQLNTSLWEITSNNNVKQHIDKLKKQMLPNR